MAYNIKAKKPLLSAESLHPKSVKKGMVKTLLTKSLRRSYELEVVEVFIGTCERLTAAGFTQECIISTLQKIKKNGSRNVRSHDDTQRKRVVMPFFHKSSYYINAMVAEFPVDVVFSNDHRLSHLMPFAEKRSTCQKKHRNAVILSGRCNARSAHGPWPRVYRADRLMV